ncbi:MAG: hypothetical protein VX392_03470 [Verrucomicrobiota bacterium]|nr:hypothetical protein [Verrucomicrobiota bacterium]
MNTVVSTRFYRDKAVGRCDDQLAIFTPNFRIYAWWAILVIGRPVICDVQVKVAIQVDIGHRHRGRTQLGEQSRINIFGKLAGTVIQE